MCPESGGTRLTETLKQPQYQPLPIAKQVFVIFAGTNGYLDDLADEECLAFERGLYRHLDLAHRSVQDEIVDKGGHDDELRKKAVQILDAYKAEFLAQRGATH